MMRIHREQGLVSAVDKISEADGASGEDSCDEVMRDAEPTRVAPPSNKSCEISCDSHKNDVKMVCNLR